MAGKGGKGNGKGQGKPKGKKMAGELRTFSIGLGSVHEDVKFRKDRLELLRQALKMKGAKVIRAPIGQPGEEPMDIATRMLTNLANVLDDLEDSCGDNQLFSEFQVQLP